MKHQPKSQAEQLTEHLDRLIREGALEGLLPSVRSLAEQNGVSTVTVLKALRLLAARGVIESRGPKRRARVTPVRRLASPLLLVVLRTPVRRLHVSIVSSLRLVQEKCRKDGMEYKEFVVDDASSEDVRDNILKSLSQNGLTRIICIHPDQKLCDVLAGLEVGVAVLPLLPVKAPGMTVFRVPHVSVLVHIIRQAHSLGHRRLVMVDNVMTPEFRSQLQAQAKFFGVRIDFVEAGSLGADNWIHDRKAVGRVCARIVRSQAGCVIFPQWSDLMACADTLARSGLAMPGRLSVAVAYLNGSVDTWHGLPVAGCEIPEDLAFRMFAAWLAEGRCDSESFGEAVIATWRAGRTMGPAARD